MKSIKESLLVALNESYKIDEPMIGSTAYDYNNDPWVIIDFCLVKEKGKVRKLIKEYDMFGEYKDNYKDGMYSEDSYAVAARNRDDEREVGLFDWNPSDLWFEKR